MDSIESYLRKLIVASVGAADLGCEKLGKLLDECVARGEVTVEKGRVLNEELKRTCKQAAARDADEKPAVDVDAMSADEREALLQKLLARLLLQIGRSSLSFELPLGFEEAAAYRKANGQYVRKNQWRDTTVTVYIDLD